MTRAALTKLLILVILAFIICLPEFFTLYRASKVNFLCLPYRPCMQGEQVKRGGNEKTGRGVTCDPSAMRVREDWKEVCKQENQRNATDPVSDLRSSGEDLDKSWFMCEADSNMVELKNNISSSGLKKHFEVSVELQLRHAESLNLTLYGLSNFSSLHPRPPKEEEGEDQGKKVDNDEGHWRAFYCCLPAPPSSGSANQSRCLLWFSNQTVLTSKPKEELAWKQTVKDEWRCVVRGLWLTLLCVVLLIVITTVLRITYWRKCTCNKSRKSTVGYNLSEQQLNDEETQTEVPSARERILPPYGSLSQAGLSPIQEVDTQDNVETLLDGPVDNCYTVNLHHRGHPSTSLTEEQT